MVGRAWLALALELEDELRRIDPSATVRPSIDSFGLLRLDVTSDTIPRRAARAAAQRFESAASGMCEQCGDPISNVRVAGPSTVLLLCRRCSPG